VIEATTCFGTPYERIDVVVHPQSIVHALVALCDGATLAHLGHPDMRVPIAYALHHPERVDVPGAARSTSPRSARSLRAARPRRLPCLRLAREAAARRAPRLRAQRRQRGRRARLPRGPADFLGIPR
jgi:1-deoxy-D-xylulose-5-phosphate reductoisomerase